MDSIWKNNVEMPKFPKLERNVKTDILIIGGGIAGILTAYFLDKCGANYILVEKDNICGGVTGNTTAKITVQHKLIYSRIFKEKGLDAARLYYRANTEALRKYVELCSKIDCDFELKDSYVFSRDDLGALEQEVKVLKKIGCKAELVYNLPLPFHIAGAVKIPGQAQFDPLKFLANISKGLKIYEHTKVTEFLDDIAVTDGGKIKANKIIITTHFPILNKHGSYFLKLYQSRSYVIALENAPNLNGLYVEDTENGLSFRNYKDLLLIGGGGHRTGKNGGNWNELRRFARKAYPESKETYHWATQDCMSLDGIPYIGQYSKTTPTLFTATGFNKWGMTSSMVAANMLKDLVTEKSAPYAKLFDPSRSILTPQLAANSAEAISNLLTPSVRRCPHLGCRLVWNKDEHSWDCPCHGSRFSESGKLLDNPSNNDLL